MVEGAAEQFMEGGMSDHKERLQDIGGFWRCCYSSWNGGQVDICGETS